MANKKVRGVTEQQELNEEFLFRDTRSSVNKFFTWVRTPQNMATFLIIHAAVAFIAPGISDLALISALIFTTWGLRLQATVPLKLPMQSGYKDRHQLHPKTMKPQLAEGIFFIGNEVATGREVWLTNSDCRQHFLVLGTTGAGKTEALIGFAANAVSWASGFLFCDGKGDVALFSKIYALARLYGREDDILVLNFMTGNQDLGAMGGKVLSNTLNPFSSGSSDSMTQMVVSLMDEVGGDGAMWKGRATAMFTGVMRALTWLRDQHIVDLNIGEIRDHLNLKKIIDLADPTKFPEMPGPVRKTVKSYLTSLPGFQEEKGYKQSQTTLDQHGYLEMQFTRILGNLADVYGHIFHTPMGEVDMHDVVLNRRILVIMLPALEKAPGEIANLGKIVVATLKGMMGATLGSKIEGTWEDVVENRLTNSSSPFICILDEVGYYTVSGLALIAAQSRSLGFSMVYASQDIPAMKRNDEKEALSIIANTNTKMFMRTEEAKETGELGVLSADKAMISTQRGYAGHVNEIGTAFRDTLDVDIKEVQRVRFGDLKAQDEGYVHILHKEHVIRARTFYANPEGSLNRKKLKLRANHFIKVAKPNADDMESQRRLPQLLERFMDPNFAKEMLAREKTALTDAAGAAQEGDEIAIAAATFNTAYDSAGAGKKSKHVEAGIAVIAKLVQEQKGVAAEYARDVRSAAGIQDALMNGDDISASDFEMGIQEQNRRARPGIGGRATGRQMGRAMQAVEPQVSVLPFGAEDEDDAGMMEMGVGRPRDIRNINSEFGELDALSQEQDASSRQVKRTPRVRSGVQHGVSIEDGEVVNMAERIGSNALLMQTLVELDYDGRTTSTQAVDSAIESAITAGSKSITDTFEGIDQEAIQSAARDAEAALEEPVKRELPARPSAHGQQGKGDGEGGEDSSGGTGDDDILQFLMDSLKSDEGKA